jgi:hypothetical protein
MVSKYLITGQPVTEPTLFYNLKAIFTKIRPTLYKVQTITQVNYAQRLPPAEITQRLGFRGRRIPPAPGVADYLKDGGRTAEDHQCAGFWF